MIIICKFINTTCINEVTVEFWQFVCIHYWLNIYHRKHSYFHYRKFLFDVRQCYRLFMIKFVFTQFLTFTKIYISLYEDLICFSDFFIIVRWVLQCCYSMWQKFWPRNVTFFQVLINMYICFLLHKIEKKNSGL